MDAMYEAVRHQIYAIGAVSVSSICECNDGLCRIHYNFVAVMGLEIMFSWLKVCQLVLLPCKASSWASMRIDVELTP